ncbi:MAG: OmpA family protein [Bacteroidota bacterium]|nr:OmpA family protein [Bacteroidota bacterium]
MSKFKTLLLIFISAFTCAIAQKSTDDKLVQLGMEVYNFGDKNDALEMFIQASDFNPLNVQANYMAGICYLETTQKFLSVKYLIRAYELNPQVVPNILFKIAQGYHLGANFEDAIRYYNQYKSELNEQVAEKLKSTLSNEFTITDKRIRECQNAIEFYKNPLGYEILPLSTEVNTEYHEYAPAINEDQSQMIFTSRRSGGVSANKDVDNDYFEDIYIAKKVNGKWLPAKNIGLTINSPTHDGSIGFSADGKILFIYKPSNGGDIFYSSRINDSTWGEPINMGAPINTKYNEPSVCISKDGNTLFFASNRTGGFGGMDIYKCEKTIEGKWGPAINLGSTINTEYDEDSPYITPDGKYLYLSSKGHFGMGEYDIYKSAWNNSTKTWSKPENLGYPINSPDNDIYFVIAGDNKTAYYASAKSGSLGGNDIFVINLEVPVKKDTLLANKSRTMAKQIKGKSITTKSAEVTSSIKSTVRTKFKVIDEKTGKLIDVTVSGIKVLNNEPVKNIRKTTEGEYELSLEPGFNYSIEIQKEGFLFYSENLDLTNGGDTKIISKTISLQRIKNGNKIVLNNVFFDHGKAVLKQESKNELELLYQLMVKNKDIRVEVSGHTDDSGTDQINNTLSTQRAKLVTEYLVKKGISQNRLIAKGYGKNRPIASNATEEGKKINRRTEFEVIKDF